LKHIANMFVSLLMAAGFNKAVIYGVVGRIWSSLAGFVTILIIARFFSQEEQGFYYTFSSLLAMQMFFELGLTGVISTFSSHEFSKLRWCVKGGVDGDHIALKRFNDILCKSTKWFGVAAFFLIFLLIPAGLFFFSEGHAAAEFSWKLPWILAVIATALNMLMVPFFAVIIGSGDVVAVNQRGMVGGIVGSLLAWCVMLFGGGLYAVFAVALGNVLISWTYLLKKKPALIEKALTGVFNKKSAVIDAPEVSWRNEIWPLQWKVALTWVSGYFIFHLFTPILFYYHGAVVAGQMGMTMSISTAISAISTVWTSAKSPELAKLVALRDWGTLDRVFFKVFFQSIGISILGAIAGLLVIFFLQENYKIGQRFLPTAEVALLFGATVVLIVSNGFAIYLRAHKEEPLMVVTVITAVFQLCSTLVLGKLYSSIGMLVGYLLIMMLFSMPAIYIIWRKCRKKWH
jgi:O-antigen/teichoic acid export membrane protein